MLSYTERQVAWYLARCPTWQGHSVCSIRRCARATGLCRSEIERALARLATISDREWAAE